MAESQSMTTPEVVAKTLIAEHGDFLRDAVAMVAAQLMEAEIAGEIGASRGERSADRATLGQGDDRVLRATEVGYALKHKSCFSPTGWLYGGAKKNC